MEFARVLENLKDVLSHELGNKRVFDKDVAHALGFSKESFSHLKRRNAIPYEAIVFFCAKRAISINWVLFEQLPKSLEAKTEQFARIKYSKELNSSAGGGAWNEEEGYEHINLLSPTFLCNTHHLHAINVMGDSMSPTLQDGSVVVVETTPSSLQNNGIYIIHSAQNGLLIKRVRLEEDGFSLISDNPLFHQEFCTYEDTSLSIAGKVIGTLEFVGENKEIITF